VISQPAAMPKGNDIRFPIAQSMIDYWNKMKLRSKFLWFTCFSIGVPLSCLLLLAMNLSIQDAIVPGILAFCTIIVSVILAWFISRRMILTLQSLNLAADQLSLGNFDVSLDIGSKVRCWEELHCDRYDCPAYGKKEDKCWFVDYTLCMGTVQDRFPEKIRDCKACMVYDKHRGDELTSLTDSFNNAIHRLRHSASEHQQMQKEMIQQERLSIIGETVAGTAHSIKNMLGMVKGGEYLVESGLASSETNRIKEGWTMVKNSNQFISDLVMKMLALCREHDPRYEEIELSEIVESVISVMQTKAQAKNVLLKVDLDKRLSRIIVDVTCIREALINLTDNAIDACPSIYGVVIIGSEKKEDRDFDIYVDDNGSGVAPDMQSQICSPFFTTKGDQGTGLGLAVTEKILSEHGGEIIIKTGRQKGSRFILRLPFLDSVPAQSIDSFLPSSIFPEQDSPKVCSRQQTKE